MSRLKLTLAGAEYFDRTVALRTGDVVPEGVDLRYAVFADVVELFRLVRESARFEAAELGISSFTTMVGKGDRRYVGIPVFTSRAFRHGFVFVGSESGVEEPQDLVGRTIGVPEYYMAAALWARGFLQHDYGVQAESIEWRYGALRTPGTGISEQRAPQNVSLRPIPVGETLEGLLEQGKLDALISARVPVGFDRGSSRVRRLFPDHRAVEQDFYRRTGIFPIMHLVVLRREVYEANRWLARSLFEAFVEARRRGRERLRELEAPAVSVPWLGAAIEEADAVFDADPYAYGFAANLVTLEALTRHSYEQGLTPRLVDPEELFAPETLDAVEEGVTLARGASV